MNKDNLKLYSRATWHVLIADPSAVVWKCRKDILEVLGLNILRIKTQLVESNLIGALSDIRGRIEQLSIKVSESPSPCMGEGLGERVRNDD